MFLVLLLLLLLQLVVGQQSISESDQTGLRLYAQSLPNCRRRRRRKNVFDGHRQSHAALRTDRFLVHRTRQFIR